MLKLILALLLVSISAFAELTPLSKTILSSESMGASFVSNGVDISKIDLLSIQAVWTGGGSPNGSFTVEVSNDDVPLGSNNQSSNVVNWTTYPSSTITISTDGSLVYNIANLGYRWARVRYVRTSGTGTVNANLVVKVK